MSITIKKYGNPYDGADDGVEKGNIEICMQVTAQAKTLAPSDKGTLRNSIMWTTDVATGGFNENGGEPAPKTISVKPKEFQGYVGSALDYSIYQEFGTRKMAPQPYLRPSIALIVKGQSAKTVLAKMQKEEMKGALKKGIKRIKF